ncbi:hypothetical protein BJF85_01880 [Saccharomonospora sp. CUA-673]|uniref:hypothetical protein n=1 Tax=Saccharomonospora sp. CUA-673 TaxID=1904969 RepID=UPI00096321A7|nr:hypothetical protein BJF85_01880 [Saccharomonospora sp. CUA-673]
MNAETADHQAVDDGAAGSGDTAGDTAAERRAAREAEHQAAVRAEHARSVHRLADAMQRWGLMLSLPPSLLVAGVLTLVDGQEGLVGAAFGVVLGQGSALITLTMMRMAATRGPASLMGFALGGYALKMTGLLAVMMLLRDVDGFSRPGLAFGMLVVVVAWAAGEVIAFQKTKTPTLVVPPPVPEDDHTDDLERDLDGDLTDGDGEHDGDHDSEDDRDKSATEGEDHSSDVTSAASSGSDRSQSS